MKNGVAFSATVHLTMTNCSWSGAKQPSSASLAALTTLPSFTGMFVPSTWYSPSPERKK